MASVSQAAASTSTAMGAFAEAVAALRPLLSSSRRDFERSAAVPEAWTTLRRTALLAIRQGVGNPADIITFWEFLSQLATLETKLRHQQILEVAAKAAQVELWAKNFWQAAEPRLAIWSLPVTSKPRSSDDVEATTAALLHHSSCPETAQAWLECQRSSAEAAPDSSAGIGIAAKVAVKVVRAVSYVYDSDPHLNYNLAVGLKGIVCEVDNGDALVDFENVGKRWLLQADLANIRSIAEVEADDADVANSIECPLSAFPEYATQQDNVGQEVPKEEAIEDLCSTSHIVEPSHPDVEVDADDADVADSIECPLNGFPEYATQQDDAGKEVPQDNVGQEVPKEEATEDLCSTSHIVEPSDSAPHSEPPEPIITDEEATLALPGAPTFAEEHGEAPALLNPALHDSDMVSPTCRILSLASPPSLSARSVEAVQDLWQALSSEAMPGGAAADMELISSGREDVATHMPSDPSDENAPGSQGNVTPDPTGDAKMSDSGDGCEAAADMAPASPAPDKAQSEACVRKTVQDVARPGRQRHSRKAQDVILAQPSAEHTAAEDHLFTEVFPQAEQEGTLTASEPCEPSPVVLSPAALGHTLRPVQQGTRVAVIGDGWGGGTGGYEAIITEADAHTFTLISLGGSSPWKETHVLRKHTFPLSSASPMDATRAAPVAARKTAKRKMPASTEDPSTRLPRR